MHKKQLTLMISIFLVLTLFLLNVNMVSSAPPITEIQQFTEGYIIEGSPTEYIKQGENFTYNFFLYNVSNGVKLSNAGISCSFYLADNTGTLKYSTVPTYNAQGYFFVLIAGGNFTNVGHYPYGVNCNSSSLGGASVGYFEVTPNGLDLTIERAIIDIGLLLMLVIFLIGCVVLFMENEHLLAKVGFLGLGYLLLIAINFIAWNMANDFLLSAPFVAEMFRILFFVLMIGAFPLLIGAFAWYFIMLWKIKEIENLMKHGMTEYDASERVKRRHR